MEGVRKLTSTGNTVDIEELQRKIAELTNENKELKKQKKFGLVWEDKPDAQVLRVRDEAPMLCEDTSRAVVTDQNATNHILINGDNFHALTALRATHTGKIDVIYIDPPYNTGNKDFIYNDDYKSDYVKMDDGYRHSKWLSFMEKRLALAKEFLAETGVIFVSIDDNEQARLKLLMDEVFGPENFLGIIVQDKQNSQNDSLNIQKNHEYIIGFRKKELTENGKTVSTIISSSLTERQVQQDNMGNYFFLADPLTTRSEGGTLNARKNLGYTIYFNESTNSIVPLMDYDIEMAVKSNKEEEVYTDDLDLISNGYIKIRPPKVRGKLGRWTWSFDKFLQEKDSIILTKTKGGYSVRPKKIVDTGTVRKSESGWVSSTESGSKGLKSIAPYSTNEGAKTLGAILSAGSFNNPKNIQMIKDLIRSYPHSDAIILDFFAGSGTTAHAVAELNKEDGGNRQCILVTDGGKTEMTGESSKNSKEDAVNIAEEITYERVRRVLTGQNWADGKAHEPLGGNLRYFKVEMEPVASGLTELDQRFSLEKYAVEHAKMAANLFNEVLSKDEFDEETCMLMDYKVFADEANECYLVGVNAHDYSLSELEVWFTDLPLTASVTMVGSGLEEIEWVRKNADRIQLDDVLGRVIRSRKYVASKLPLV